MQFQLRCWWNLKLLVSCWKLYTSYNVNFSNYSQCITSGLGLDLHPFKSFLSGTFSIFKLIYPLQVQCLSRFRSSDSGAGVGSLPVRLHYNSHCAEWRELCFLKCVQEISLISLNIHYLLKHCTNLEGRNIIRVSVRLYWGTVVHWTKVQHANIFIKMILASWYCACVLIMLVTSTEYVSIVCVCFANIC